MLFLDPTCWVYVATEKTYNLTTLSAPIPSKNKYLSCNLLFWKCYVSQMIFRHRRVSSPLDSRGFESSAFQNGIILWKKRVLWRNCTKASKNFRISNARVFWEGDGCLDDYYVFRLSRNPKVFYCVHKKPPMEPILIQLSSIRTVWLLSVLILTLYPI